MEFNDFKQKLYSGAFFVEEKPEIFVQCSVETITLKHILIQVNNFQKVKGAVRKMLTNKNKVICIDNTDKNLGAATADKCDVIN